ncbi:MAG: histidine--tRNA ligase [Elusimicrobia bacterium]|nr:histidine--tRNA ligase [Elusimicrobiota bacterium]
MAETQPVRGFRDLTAPESTRTAALEAAARETLSLYGFSEIRLPTLELAELFVKSTGETSDIVEKEMFRFEDQGGRALALRPEGTPGVVRAYLDKSLRQQGGPVKLYYVGSMFRAERPQKGRYREFEQIGVETLGNPHPAADVEAILALNALFAALGLEGRVRLRVNNLGCDTEASCRPAFRDALRAYLHKHLDTLCDSCKRRVDRNPLRVLDCKGDGPRLSAEAPRFASCAACKAHVDQVSALLTDNGLTHAYPDPTLVRGLDYYTRTVFEFAGTGLGSQDAVAGGGRYDGLVKLMGGPDTPAVGWALGVERLLLAVEASDPSFKKLEAHRGTGRDVFVAVQGTEAPTLAKATRLMETMRRFSIRAGGGLFASSLKAQMREAGREEARWCVIIGDAEAAKLPPTCQLKDMTTGAQSEVLIDAVKDAIATSLSKKEPTHGL